MDSNRFYPIAVSQVNWPTFIALGKDAIGESPTRGLDANNIPISHPEAFLRSVNLENDPRNALKDARALDHVFLTCMAACKYRAIVEDLAENSRLRTLIRNDKWDCFVIIVSGTLTEWADFAIRRDKLSPQGKEMMISVIDVLKQLGVNYV